MAKKAVDPIKAKQKKQKILAAVLGVVFLGLMVFQVPRVMKQLNPPSPPVAATTTTTPTAGTPSLAAPTLGGAEQPASVTGATPAPGTPVVQDGQLASFSRFASKDPFAQQLSEDKPGSSTSSGPSGSSGSSGSGTQDPGIPDIPGNSPAPGGAVISVNGTLYSVSVDSDFPTASATDPTIVPLFHLVSATEHTAKISIVGGAYSNGSRTVTLRENKPVTLMNTADGTRYTLVLKPQGTSAEGEGGSGGGGSSTTPPATVTLPAATP